MFVIAVAAVLVKKIMIKDANFTIGLYSKRGLFSSSVTAAASLSSMSKCKSHCSNNVMEYSLAQYWNERP